jgi:hypothetical protein
MFFNDVFSNLDDMKENTSCFVCQKHIDLVQRSIKCRCKQVFCDAHRPHDRHSCPIDYKELGRHEVLGTLSGGQRRQKQGLHDGDLTSVSMQYSLHHPESPRTLVYSHSLALLVFVMYTIAALYYWDVAMFCKGYALSFACARMGHVLVSGYRGVSHALGFGVNNTYCFWSAACVRHPLVCLQVERKTLVSNLRFLLSQGKKNCMTQDLYRAKGLTDILAVVFARLQRLGEPT